MMRFLNISPNRLAAFGGRSMPRAVFVT